MKYEGSGSKDKFTVKLPSKIFCFIHRILFLVSSSQLISFEREEECPRNFQMSLLNYPFIMVLFFFLFELVIFSSDTFVPSWVHCSQDRNNEWNYSQLSWNEIIAYTINKMWIKSLFSNFCVLGSPLSKKWNITSIL